MRHICIITVGEAVGLVVGLVVGEVVGLDVGLVVGDEVGEGVGGRAVRRGGVHPVDGAPLVVNDDGREATLGV